MGKPAKSKSLCVGCHNDYYNHNGNSHTGECWMFENAKLVKRKCVHIDQRPPWNQNPIWVFDCYSERGYVYVGANQIR